MPFHNIFIEISRMELFDRKLRCNNHIMNVSAHIYDFIGLYTVMMLQHASDYMSLLGVTRAVQVWSSKIYSQHRRTNFHL